jgi:lipoyl(octanoyl) transferase
VNGPASQSSPQRPPPQQPHQHRFISIDLGRLAYAKAYEVQVATLDRIVAAREDASQPAPLGVLLFVEHDPVITISRRAGAANNLLASADTLRAMGVSVEETDRGGDITYHGPGQLVAYPIVDLNALNLGLHEYMRLLEESVIRTARDLGVHADRDATATGAWVPGSQGAPAAKLCACGVRVRRWVSMHGLAINVTTNLQHFNLIVPCGLTGRPVTSLQALLGDACPPMPRVRQLLEEHLLDLLSDALATARAKRDAAATKGSEPANSSTHTA